MERTTRSETCPSENGRDACRMSDEGTVDTEFDPALETRVEDRTHPCPDLNSVETIERRRGVEMPLVLSRFLEFLFFPAVRAHVPRRTQSPRVAAKFCAQEICVCLVSRRRQL